MKAIINADVYSVNMDGTEIRGEAVIIDGEKITFVGSMEGARARMTDDTEVIDAGGHTVLPGFCDAHLHPSFSGSAMFSCNLFRLSKNGEKGSVDEKIQRALKKYIEDNPDMELVKGCGWDMADFLKAFPDKSTLDAICPDKPVMLESYCQHHLWLNSKALEIAGITAETPQPRDGTIHLDENGEPTGLLSEFAAMDIAKKAVPGYDYSVEEYKEIFRMYQREFAQPYGVTMVFDALSSENAKAAYVELAKSGELTIRVRDNYYADPTKPESQFDDMIAAMGSTDVDDLYVKKTVKFFMESSIPDTYFTEPYSAIATKMLNKPKDHRGFPFWEKEELQRIIPKLMKAGFQIHTHAMGDGSIKHTIDGYEHGYKETGMDTRNVIAHVMLVRPEDFARMAENKVMACVQPTWMAMSRSDIRTTKLALGKARTEQMYPYRRFLDHGVIVSAGTDFPVTPPPCPFIEMETAVTRRLTMGADGKAQWSRKPLAPRKNPEQDIVEIKDVVKSRTISGAYQCFAEEYTGSLEQGKSAELIILDRNIFETPVNEIHNTKVMTTIFKGKVVYQR